MGVNIISLFSIILICTQSWANPFPWVPPGTTQLHTLEDPYIDMALRVELIRLAKKSIRIAVYQQIADNEVGLPILHALREAAFRGVEIQFLTSTLTSMIFDRDNIVTRMLADANLPRPAQILFFGGVRNKLKGWNISDSMHEKIFLIDDEIAILGGRNQGRPYLDWLDYDVLIKGNGIVDEIHSAFNEIWADVLAISQIERSTKVKLRDLPNPAIHRQVSLTQEREQILNEILAWVAGDKSVAERHTASAFEPKSARVITHRFLNQLRTGNYNGTSRFQMQDAVVNELINLVKVGHDIRISTMYAFFHPKLKDALIEALKRGASLYVHLNGDVSAREVIPFGLSYHDSLRDLLELMQIKKDDGTPANVHIAVFQQTNFKYLHKKIFIADDHVIFGSHNFNFPSSFSNSEISLEADDPHFAQIMSLLYDRDFIFSGRPLTIDEATKDFQSNRVSRWLAELIHNFF